MTSVNLKPILVPIDDKTWFYNTKELLTNIDEKTLAIVIVSFFGNAPCYPIDIDETYTQVFSEIPVIADWAQSYGVTPDLPGYFNHVFTIYSFGAGKSMSIAGGGLVQTANRDADRQLKKSNIKLRNPGVPRSILAIVRFILFNIALSPLIWPIAFHLSKQKQARLLYKSTIWPLYKLPDFMSHYIEICENRLLDEISKRRQNTVTLYNKLESIENIQLPEIGDLSKSACTRFPIIFESGRKMKICRDKLISSGSLCGAYTWEEYNTGSENSGSISERLLTIPTYPKSEIAYDFINKAIRETVKN